MFVPHVDWSPAVGLSVDVDDSGRGSGAHSGKAVSPSSGLLCPEAQMVVAVE
jgi:hypothetical protein